ncbi:hypothetical protein [Paraburkholderia sp. BL6665CI2N2]|uniref:hypothetical protein n=1 Tax=Paraburkholderia sp. BL6665CI2N2 TaxID=1938806 RepID=UPI001AB05474|nr:hypothetical protein [Paraburkholderia sp. BL6665CI2N2]
MAQRLHALACQVACAAVFARIDMPIGQRPELQRLRQIGRISEIAAVLQSIVFPDGNGMGQFTR